MLRTLIKQPLLVRVLCVLLLAQSCLFGQRKSTNGRGEGASLFDRNSFVISRTAGGSTALVQFAAGKPILCSFDIYAQRPDQDPKESAPKVVPCSNSQASAAIKETIPGLQADALYFFRVTAWSPETAKEKGEILVVKESPFGADSTVLVEPDGRFRDVMVSRIDIPLKTTEVHRHVFANSTSSQDLRNILVRPQGCKPGPVPSPGDIDTADLDFRAANVATRGFASGSGQPHINYRERIKIIANSLQFADRWEWVFDIFGKSQNFFAKAPSQLQSVDVSSTNSLALKSSRLREDEEPILAVDAAKPLQVRWRTEGLSDSSAVIVQVGRGSTPSLFYCVFDSASGVGSIDAGLIAALPAGRHTIVTTLESSQVLVAQNTGAWLITGNDFKSGVLER